MSALLSLLIVGASVGAGAAAFYAGYQRGRLVSVRRELGHVDSMLERWRRSS